MSDRIKDNYKPLPSSYANIVPQVSIREVSELLGLDLNTFNNEEVKGVIDLDMKRCVSTTTWSMQEGGIAIVRRGGIDVYAAAKKKAALIIGEFAYRNTDAYSVKLPKGMTARNAYTKICRYIREQYKIPCIAVTGNAGKTTTKDLISSVLMQKYNTLCVAKNYNTWYTSGEILQNLTDKHDIYVQEAHEPHAESVSFMVQPNSVLITNVERAHFDETGASLNASIEATLKILSYMKNDGTVFINNDCPYLSKYDFDKYNVVKYSANKGDCDYWAEDIVNHGTYNTFKICSKTDDDIEAVLYVAGIHNVNNAVGAYAVGRHYGLEPAQIINALETFRPDGVRQNMLKVGNSNVLVDCYSTTILSSVAAGKALCELNIADDAKRIMILSYLPSLGSGTEAVHRDVGKNIAALPIDKIIGYRNDAKYIIDECKKAGKDAVFFQYHEEVKTYLKEIFNDGDAVVFKGVTYAHLEQVANDVFGLNIIPDNRIENDRPHNGGDF